nr:hypothetical protein [Sphingomicrobium flavum]
MIVMLLLLGYDRPHGSESGSICVPQVCQLSFKMLQHHVLDSKGRRVNGLPPHKSGYEAQSKAPDAGKMKAHAAPYAFVLQHGREDFPMAFFVLSIFPDRWQQVPCKQPRSDSLGTIDIDGTILASVIHFDHLFGYGFRGPQHHVALSN